MQQYSIKVLVISISNPILIGIYKDNVLIDTIRKEGKTSDVLPSLFNSILDKYKVEEVFYVNGPGSYMAIKIAYIFLKTISIVHNIDLYAVSGFDFNNNSPIKALGKKYFFREIIDFNEEIVIKFLEHRVVEEFSLPKTLSDLKYSDKILPEYNLPAV